MNTLVKNLQSIIDNGLKNTVLPYKKGNSIRIGKIAIRYSKNNGYILFDVSDKKQIAMTFSKGAALAIAKNPDNNILRNEILRMDSKLQKHYNDSLFYQNTLDKSEDNIRKFVAEDRLILAKENIEYMQSLLEDIIFES